MRPWPRSCAGQMSAIAGSCFEIVSRAITRLTFKRRQLAHHSKIATGWHCYISNSKGSGATKVEKVMKFSRVVAVIDDRAVDIMIYTLGGFSIVLSVATGLGALFFLF
jgi:hypothetical protein